MRTFWIKYSIITVLLGLSIAALTIFLTGDASPYQSLADIDEYLVKLSSQSWKLHLECFETNFMMLHFSQKNQIFGQHFNFSQNFYIYFTSIKESGICQNISNSISSINNGKIIITTSENMRQIKINNGRTKTVAVVCGLIANDFDGVDRCLQAASQLGTRVAKTGS